MLHHFVNLLKVSKGLIDAQGFNGLMMGWCNLHFPSCCFTSARSADLCVPWAMSSRLGKDLSNWAICSRRPSPLGSKFSKWWFIYTYIYIYICLYNLVVNLSRMLSIQDNACCSPLWPFWTVRQYWLWRGKGVFEKVQSLKINIKCKAQMFFHHWIHGIQSS